jgi:hypothetical protein
MHIFSFLPPIPGIDLFPLKILIFLWNSTIPRFLFS